LLDERSAPLLTLPPTRIQNGGRSFRGRAGFPAWPRRGSRTHGGGLVLTQGKKSHFVATSLGSVVAFLVVHLHVVWGGGRQNLNSIEGEGGGDAMLASRMNGWVGTWNELLLSRFNTRRWRQTGQGGLWQGASDSGGATPGCFHGLKAEEFGLGPGWGRRGHALGGRWQGPERNGSSGVHQVHIDAEAMVGWPPAASNGQTAGRRGHRGRRASTTRGARSRCWTWRAHLLADLVVDGPVSLGASSGRWDRMAGMEDERPPPSRRGGGPCCCGRLPGRHTDRRKTSRSVQGGGPVPSSSVPGKSGQRNLPTDQDGRAPSAHRRCG